jgi:sulfate transport system ATP-binding protein
MSVRRNIGYSLEVRGVSKADRRRRTDELLALVQLEGYGDGYPLQLSGGQRQRVGFARALASRPEILLLDEPFGSLDTQVRLELREWLTQLHQTTRLTTLMVTHDQEEALELSQQIVVMDRGRVVQAGTPSQIYDQPKTPFVASFVGTGNVLRGTVEGAKITVGSLSVAVPSGVPDGSEVQAIVRPHHFRLEKNGAAPGRSVGTITRLVGLGGNVKLQLKLPSNQSVTVQLSRREAESMSLEVGDIVTVDLAEAKVFVANYSI